LKNLRFFRVIISQKLESDTVPAIYRLLLNLAITLSTNRAKLEPFDKTNAGNPHKYRLSAF
jgi:hypothetical protein